jgi:hypothetical protein
VTSPGILPRKRWRRSSIVIACAAVAGCLVTVSVAVRQRRARHKVSAALESAPFGSSRREDLPGLGEENRRSIAEATRLGKPERLSPLIAAPAFDREAFERDPKGYLSVVEPARCFQTAPPGGPESVYLKAVTSLDLEVEPGPAVPIIVSGVPGMPVTFTAFGVGTFRENELNSVTVLADSHGFAVANALLPPGGRATMHVQVGSPVAVGSQLFSIRPGIDKGQTVTNL